MEPLEHPDGGVEGEALDVPQACPKVLRGRGGPGEPCCRCRDVAPQTLQQTRPTAQHTTPTFVNTPSRSRSRSSAISSVVQHKSSVNAQRPNALVALSSTYNASAYAPIADARRLPRTL